MENTAKPRRPTLNLTMPDEDPEESWHQTKIFDTVELNLALVPDLHDLYAVPNGGFRFKATAVAMKRQGVRRGVPDLSLDVPRTCTDGNSYHGLKLELKRFKNGSIEDEQKERLTRNAANGYRAIVCWGWIAAWEEILWYLGREDLLIPSNHVTTRVVEAYPEFPFWQRRRQPIRSASGRLIK